MEEKRILCRISFDSLPSGVAPRREFGSFQKKREIYTLRVPPTQLDALEVCGIFVNEPGGTFRQKCKH